MNIKICSNIAKYRKENGVTQAELSEYLGVSPQAVSKWEQETSMPDIYLIPKIAFFFDISINTLLGTSDIDTADLLVSKYSVVRNDKNYKDAKETVDTLLETDPDNLKALGLLCHLEYQKSLEFLYKSKEVCEKLQKLATETDKDWEKRATIQLMRENAMLGNYCFVEQYKQKFNEAKTVDNFNYLLVALGENHQYEEILRTGNDYIDTFSREEQWSIYPNLMDAAYTLGNLEYVQKCFEAIVEDKSNTSQLFNAWCLLWKTYKKVGNDKEAERCKKELLNQLPNQIYNEYVYEKIRKHLVGEGDKPEIIL
jgi:transcriptional regulator with XRE-family HTH domain